MADLGNGFRTELPTPSLRNGALGDMVAIVPSTAIPIQYHWNMIGGVPDDRVMAYTELNMRLQYAIISAGDAGMSADKRRSQAIILGAMRTGLRIYWKIMVADLSPGEVGRAYVSYRAAAPNATPPVQEGVNVTWGTATATTAGAAWAGWDDLSALEREVAEAFILLSVAALPTSGWSIVKTGHHFLSQAGQSARAGYTAVKKQWFTKMSAAVAAWVRQREEYWEDIAFHKACHPVLMSVAVALASDRNTKLKLESVDFGAAAVRLPATAPQLEYAKMVLALLIKVGGVLTAAGATIDTRALYSEITAVYESADPVERSKHVAAATIMAHSCDASLAVAAGILLHITEASTPSTIASSHGFKRLIEDFPAAVTKGSTLSRSLAARERQAIAEGGQVSISIVF